MRDLSSGDLGMARFSAAEAHLYFYFVAVFEKASSRSDADLEVMVVRARSDAHFFDLRNMLVLSGIASAFVLLETKLAEIGDATDGWICAGRDFDQIEAGLLGGAQGILDGHHAHLLALFIDDANLWDPNLAVGARTGRNRRA
jgi:hypothetical protein